MSSVERVAGALASRSHGVVTRRGLLATGLTPRQIDRLVARGVLLAVHRGVYRVGHAAPSVEASYLAAVLACGEAARLGGAAAAHLLAMLDGSPPAPVVWAPTARRVPGVHTRRSAQIASWGRWVWRGVPIVPPARVLVDVAGALSLDRLIRVCHQAQVLHGVKPRSVAIPPNAPGAARLRAALDGAPVSIGALEKRFLRVLRQAGLPLPDETNRLTGSFRIDCRWRRQRVTVELDSYRFHNSRQSWERDRRREREAYARGDQFRRYTWGDVFEHPALMLAELGTLLT